jgi:hypothetical protein
MSPDDRRRLKKVQAIVRNCALNPEIPANHPLVSAMVELAYLVGSSCSEPKEDRE